MTWRRFAAGVVAAVFLGIAAVIGLVAYGQRQFTTPGPLEQAIFFSIPRGASVVSVSNSLLAQGAIRSARIFQAGAAYTDEASKIKFGTFEIPAGASMEDILDLVTRSAASREQFVVTLSISGTGSRTTLRERIAGADETRELAKFGGDEQAPEEYLGVLGSGQPVEFRISVPEGLTNWQVVQGLNDADFLAGEIEQKLAEGTLAPDTYQVERDSQKSALVARMAEAQSATLAAEWETRSEQLPYSTPEEALILASIIEKETGVPDERDQVASVFVNRLNRNMRLQTDPTVIYGLSEGRGALDRGLQRSDLEIENPYNTYLNDGFPPTPIANPGRLAIRAALHPAETRFLYFVADGTGGHAFAETYAEHQRNVQKWRRVARSQGREN